MHIRIRFFLLLAVVLLLPVACAPLTMPSGFETVRPALRDTEFVNRDGMHLPLSRWMPRGKPRAIVVALHGMNDYRHAFALAGPRWAARGILVLAYDQRGFGGAPFPGIWPGADALRTDFSDCVRVVRERYPGVPVFALGTSMGGAVVLSDLAGSPPPLDGVVLAAPAVWSRSEMPWLYRAALWLAAHGFPSWQFTGRGLKIWPSDNIAMLRANACDLNILKRTRADAVEGLVDLMDEAFQAPGRLQGRTPPMLLVYGAHDQIVPKAATKAVIAALGDRVEARRYPDGYHMILRDLHRDVVQDDIAVWILSHTRR